MLNERLLLLIGGKIDGVRSEKVYRLEEGGEEFVRSEEYCLEERIAGSGVVGMGEKGVLVCGGNTGKEVVGRSYLMKEGECRIDGEMKYVRDELGVVVGRDGCVYAIGGYGFK